MFAEGFGDGARPDAQDDHAVVGQHVLPHCVPEAEPVELRSVAPGVGHVDDIDAPALERPLGALRIDRRGRRHVETLRGVKADVVVELLEVDFDPVRGTPVHTGGSVGLVGDGEVERWRAVRCVCLGDPTDGVVRREHGTSVAGSAEEVRDPRRVRGDGALQFGAPDVLPTTLGGRVGADDWRLQGTGALALPLAAGLRHQGDRAAKRTRPPSGTIRLAIRSAVIAKHLANEFPAVLLFLRDSSIDAANWRAEQAIRPPVVIRKV